MEFQNISNPIPIDIPNKDQRIAKKLKLAKSMLVATALAQGLAMAYGFYTVLEANKAISSLYKDVPAYTAKAELLPMSFAFSFWGALIIVAAVLVLKELREPKGLHWAMGVGVFLMALPTWALPAAVIGVLALLDREVREKYLKELDISL